MAQIGYLNLIEAPTAEVQAQAVCWVWPSIKAARERLYSLTTSCLKSSNATWFRLMRKKTVHQIRKTDEFSVHINEHLPYNRVSYYTMPIDYLEYILGDRLVKYCKFAGVKISTFKNTNFLTDHAARRIHEASHGALMMLPLNRPKQNLTEQKLTELCQREKHYQRVYERANPSQ